MIIGESGPTYLTDDEYSNYYYWLFDYTYGQYGPLDDPRVNDYYYDQNYDFVLCKWFDSGTSSIEISFTSNSKYTSTGVKMFTACVSATEQYANRLEWSQRHLTSSGNCEHGMSK